MSREKRAEEEPLLDAHRRRHGELDRELASGSIQSTQLEPLIDDRGFAGRVEAPHARGVSVAECRRDDRLHQLLAEYLFTRPSERRFGLRVPRHDPPCRVDADVRIVCRLHDLVRAGIAFRQAGQCLPPLFLGDGHDDQVADRDAEVLLVDGPGPGAAHVLRAQDAESAVVALQRDVEHGADTVRIEIRVTELTRTRIGSGITGGHDALAVDGVEIGREVVAIQHRSGLVPIAGAVIQTHAANQCVLVVELPHAQSLDPQGASRDVQDAPQSILEVLAGIGVARGELGQRIALRREPAPTGLERIGRGTKVIHKRSLIQVKGQRAKGKG